MTVAVLSTGTELTRGELVGTNAAWLSDQLTALGCRVVEHRTVPDDQSMIGEALRSLCAVHRFVVCTGGLGPTSDDLTAAAVAAAAGVGLRRDEPSLERIGRRRAARGREMTALDAKQADLPAGAEVLPNPAGTAPGFVVELSGCHAFFLPGVPSEMRRMFQDFVRPRVASATQRRDHQVRLRTFGLSESAVAERLSGVETEFEGVTLGYRSSFPEVEVKVRAQGSDQAAAELAAVAATAVRRRLGDVLYSEGEDSYPAYIGRCLRDRGLTLALAESCTGGMIGSMLVSVPGSSEYLLLDAVTYSNRSKTKLLGVRPEILRGHGAVSAECAAAMAEGARRIVDANIAVSVTGIAGPGGGTEEKPVGTVWMGVAVSGVASETHHFMLHGDRGQIRRRAAYFALRLVARAALAHNA